MARPDPFFNPSGTAMSIADAIRAQANNQAVSPRKKKGKKRDTPLNPLDQLMQQIQSINVEPTPYETLLQQATGSAGSQFDPLIQQLQAEMQRTEKRGKANQAEARNMYNALSQDIAAQLPEITNRMAQASQETEDRYNSTQQALQNQYSQQATQQAELFKKLGIQAAAPEASQQAMEDQAYFQNQIESDETAALQLLKEIQNADVSYNQQTANNTRLAGENTAQDIATQLEDYLQMAGGKLSGLQAGRESAIQGMLAQLQQQDSQRMASQEQQEYQRLMDLFNLQLRMQEMQAKYAPKSDQLFKGTNGPSGAANYLSEVYGGDSFTSKAIFDAVKDVLDSPEAVEGKYESPNLKDQYGNPVMNKTTNEYLIRLLRQRMAEGDLDPNTPAGLGATQFSDFDIDNAINTLLAMMGKLR